MSFDYGKAIEIAAVALAEAASVAPKIGSEDHVTAANDALAAADEVAKLSSSDPQIQAEESAAVLVAQSLIRLVASIRKHKSK